MSVSLGTCPSVWLGNLTTVGRKGKTLLEKGKALEKDMLLNEDIGATHDHLKKKKLTV